MKHVRRRLVAQTLDCVTVLAAVLLLCGALAFFVLTVTAAQEGTSTNSRGISATSTGHAMAHGKIFPPAGKTLASSAKNLLTDDGGMCCFGTLRRAWVPGTVWYTPCLTSMTGCIR
jgi:hypothetical protein